MVFKRKLMNLYIVNCDVLHVKSELLKIPNLLIIKKKKDRYLYFASHFFLNFEYRSTALQLFFPSLTYTIFI